MEELEEIKKRKLEQLQQQLKDQQEEQQKIQQELAVLENFIKPRLSKEALVRFGNLKAGQPKLAIQVLVVLSQLIKAGKLSNVDDDTLKEILQEILPKKRETKIIRK
jgi:programmed cell death protein 5